MRSAASAAAIGRAIARAPTSDGRPAGRRSASRTARPIAASAAARAAKAVPGAPKRASRQSASAARTSASGPTEPRVDDAAARLLAEQRRRARPEVGGEQLQPGPAEHERTSVPADQRMGAQAVAVGPEQRQRRLGGQQLAAHGESGKRLASADARRLARATRRSGPPRSTASQATTVPAMRTPPRNTNARVRRGRSSSLVRAPLLTTRMADIPRRTICCREPNQACKLGERWSRRVPVSDRIWSPRATEADGVPCVDVSDPETGTNFRLYDFEYQLALQLNGQPLTAVTAWAAETYGVDLTPTASRSSRAGWRELGFLETPPPSHGAPAGAAAAPRQSVGPSTPASGGPAADLAGRGGRVRRAQRLRVDDRGRRRRSSSPIRRCSTRGRPDLTPVAPGAAVAAATRRSASPVVEPAETPDGPAPPGVALTDKAAPSPPRRRAPARIPAAARARPPARPGSGPGATAGPGAAAGCRHDPRRRGAHRAGDSVARARRDEARRRPGLGRRDRRPRRPSGRARAGRRRGGGCPRAPRRADAPNRVSPAPPGLTERRQPPPPRRS